MKHSLGIIQGRLSPPIGGKIQCFPWETWKQEYLIAHELGFESIEWTIDADGFWENPLCTPEGRSEIFSLMEKTGVKTCSLTADVIMHEPFYKLAGEARVEAVRKFRHLVNSCASLGIQYLVFPCVDNGAITNLDESKRLLEECSFVSNVLSKSGLRIVFESDYGPTNLAEWIYQFDSKLFGINYDMGNSSSLGHRPKEEWDAYGDRIWNVHVKDRTLNGGTVALETGHTNFDEIFESIRKHQYKGMFIFQIARGPTGDEVETAKKHVQWIRKRLL